MAIQTVTFTLNGVTTTLTLDSSSGNYKGTVTAPSTTSYNQNTTADGDLARKYHGTVTATDTAGNSTTATTANFSTLALRVKEKTAPTISVTYPTASAYITNSKPTIKWTVTDSGSGIDTSTISIKIDSGSAVTSGITTTATTNGYTCQYTPTSALSEGSHTITFNVSDNDGNAATAKSVTFTVDTVPPTLNVSAPSDGYVTNNATLTVSGTTNDATSSPCTVTVNGTSVTVGSDGAFTTTVKLSEGSNTITVIAKDAAGKTTTVTRTVTLDTVAPTITAITLSPNPVDCGATYVVTVTVSDS
jgi:hypothetical protein